MQNNTALMFSAPTLLTNQLLFKKPTTILKSIIKYLSLPLSSTHLDFLDKRPTASSRSISQYDEAKTTDNHFKVISIMKLIMVMTIRIMMQNNTALMFLAPTLLTKSTFIQKAPQQFLNP